MIPRIKTGDSFKGAALYYLHDKRLEGEEERFTGDRLSWTFALNTLENEPEAVIREMQHTAMSQQRLKMQAGNRIDGRPTERTVMTVSLAWSPTQSPTKEQMIETGRSFLNRMGWEEHQVLFVAHNDTKHPHIHLVINRIHPETGMTMDDKWFKTRAQKWALAYEREQGQIFCHKREARYGRDHGRAESQMGYGEWQLWREIAKDGTHDPEFQKALQAGEWDALKGGQRDARIGFWQETGRMRNELRAALREDVRAEFAPQWAAYARDKAERDDKAKLYDREARRAIRELRKQRGAGRMARPKQVTVERGADGRTYVKQRRVESQAIEQIKERRKAYHARHREDLWQMRSAIASRQKVQLGAMIDCAMNQFSADREKDYDQLLASHRGEKAELRNDQRAGERRRDVLPGQPASASHLSPEQTAAYVAQAREFAKAGHEQFEKTRREVSDADRARHAGQDPQVQKAEAHDRTKEKKDKDQAQEGKRQSDVQWYIEKRAADRARDRDGGRDR